MNRTILLYYIKCCGPWFNLGLLVPCLKQSWAPGVLSATLTIFVAVSSGNSALKLTTISSVSDTKVADGVPEQQNLKQILGEMCRLWVQFNFYKQCRDNSIDLQVYWCNIGRGYIRLLYIDEGLGHINWMHLKQEPIFLELTVRVLSILLK